MINHTKYHHNEDHKNNPQTANHTNLNNYHNRCHNLFSFSIFGHNQYFFLVLNSKILTLPSNYYTKVLKRESIK